MLNEELERELSARIDEIDQALAAQVSDISLLSLAHPAQHILAAGGKRIQPLVLVLTTEALAGTHDKFENEQLMSIAVALELTTTFSATHEAIIHDFEGQCGVRNVPSMYNRTTDILSGDFLYSKAVEVLLDTSIPSETRSKCLSILLRSCVRFCEGAMLEHALSSEPHVTEDEYFAMIEKKSGALYEGAAKIGAILGDADNHVVTQLGEYGQNLGLATRLSDEILTATNSRTDRRTSRDRQRRPTLATVHSPQGRRDSLDGDQISMESISQTSPYLKESGSFDYVHQRAIAYAMVAKSQLNLLSESVAKTLLCELADRTVLRISNASTGSADHA